MRAELRPLILLIGLEALLAGPVTWLSPPHIGPLVALTAGVVLATGLLPAILRPSHHSARVGAFAVLVASVIFQSSAAEYKNFPGFDQLAQLLPAPRPALSLANVAMLMPTALHINARFPRRSALSDGQLIAAYLASGGLAAAILLIEPLRVELIYALALLAYLLLAVSGYLLIQAIRDPRPEHRRGVIQARLIFASFLLAESPLLATPIAQLLGADIPYWALLATQICFPVGISYAILRHDLFGIDAALRRALAYAVVSLGFLAIYLGLTAALTQLLRESPRPLLATTAGILVAAAAFSWMRGRAQLLITRAFYPERLSFQRDVDAAQDRLARVVRRDEVVRLLTVDLPARLDATSAGLEVLHPHPHLAESGASVPRAPAQAERGWGGEGPAWRADLLVAGRPIGAYWLGPRRSGLAYAPDERERLLALAQQAALALAYAETVEALEDLNRELEDRVAARSAQLLAQQRELVAIAERQRLARDLHDSLKQALFSLGLSLHAARGLVARDPQAADAILAEQEALAVQAQRELGGLLADLREPTGQRGDLVAALRREGARLYERHGLRVLLDGPDRLPLAEPALSELAAVAREALHNVLKHSGAAEAHVCLEAGAATLRLTVADQGRGFDYARRAGAGHGLRGMQERLDALGGTLTIVSAEGRGTELCAQIPHHAASA